MHFQNCSLEKFICEIAPSKTFRNCSLKEHFFKTALLKNTFLELFSQKKTHPKNCSLKKYFLEIAPLKNTFLELLS